MTEPRENLYGVVGLLLGVAALVGSFVSETLVVAVVGVCGLTIAAIGVWRAVQIDYGMSRSIAGVLLCLFALVVWVFSRGGTTAV